MELWAHYVQCHGTCINKRCDDKQWEITFEEWQRCVYVCVVYHPFILLLDAIAAASQAWGVLPLGHKAPEELLWEDKSLQEGQTSWWGSHCGEMFRRATNSSCCYSSLYLWWSDTGSSGVGYRSHLNQYDTDTGKWHLVLLPNSTFSRYESKLLDFNIIICFEYLVICLEKSFPNIRIPWLQPTKTFNYTRLVVPMTRHKWNTLK